MPTIYLDSHLDAAAEAVWQHVRDIRAPERLTTMIHRVEVTGTAERSCETEHGTIVERIISVDDDRYRVAYTAIRSPFPATHHNAALIVTDEEGGSLLTWTTDIEPAEVADAIRPILAAEFTVIVSRLTALTADAAG